MRDPLKANPLFAECDTRARNLGMYLDTVNPQLNRDIWWLVSGRNWMSYDKGQTLEQVKKRLDVLEGSA